jgi:hypothetical protein
MARPSSLISRFGRKGDFFFIKRENKARYTYSWELFLTKISRSTKKYITPSDLHIVGNYFLHKKTTYKNSTNVLINKV